MAGTSLISVGGPIMTASFDIAGRIVQDQLAHSAPHKLEILSGITREQVVVVKGQHDHMDQVLRSMGRKFVHVTPQKLTPDILRSAGIAFVNCTRDFPQDKIALLKKWVNWRGWMVSSDWALTVVEQAFPGFISCCGHKIDDRCAPVEVLDPNEPLTQALLGQEVNPVWWFEGGSYPIRIDDHRAVQVLIRSTEQLVAGCENNAVLVRFKPVPGGGVLHHMSSHLYAQRTEHRDQRHMQDVSAYTTELGTSPEVAAWARRAAAAQEGTSYGSVQAATTTSQLVTEMFVQCFGDEDTLSGEDTVVDGG